MIKINLLPEELKGHESSFTNMKMNFNLRGRSVRNIAIAAVVVLAVAHASLFFYRRKKRGRRIGRCRQKYKGLLPGKRECDALKAEVSVTNKKARAIEGLMADRFSWAKKLNDLSDSLAPGIWLTAVTYEERLSEAFGPVGQGGRQKRRGKGRRA